MRFFVHNKNDYFTRNSQQIRMNHKSRLSRTRMVCSLYIWACKIGRYVHTVVTIQKNIKIIYFYTGYHIRSIKKATYDDRNIRKKSCKTTVMRYILYAKRVNSDGRVCSLMRLSTSKSTSTKPLKTLNFQKECECECEKNTCDSFSCLYNFFFIRVAVVAIWFGLVWLVRFCFSLASQHSFFVSV